MNTFAKASLPAVLVLLAACATTAQPVGPVTVLPAQFDNARVLLVPETVTGERIAFYTDTGGGWNMLHADVAQRLGLSLANTRDIDGRRVPFVDLPAFREGRSIPPLHPEFLAGQLAVIDQPQFAHEGFLGGRWFADRVWLFDYPARTLHLLSGWSASPDDPHAVTLGFQADDAGNRSTHFPRMAITVDGETLDMLLDTGATGPVTQAAATHVGVPAGTWVGASFITQSVFEKWAKRHPDWLVVEKAEATTGMPMIRVPQVTIGGNTVGPVWFTQRPDRAFHDYMSSMMDAPIEGAIGGSAFRYLRMVIDYPRAIAWFYAP